MASANTGDKDNNKNVNEDYAEHKDSRLRQTKRDDAIRKRIEHDLSKRKRYNLRTTRQKKATPGTVASLKPSEPLICKPNFTVYEVSQIMSTKRENCILVVNEEGELIGIFTAKDLAFRVVGAGHNSSSITIDQIMTPNPMCANANTASSEALTLMVHRGFRHLPVLDDQNQILGILEITKSYAQQMEKLERFHASWKNLYDALAVNTEIGVLQQPLHVFQYFESLRRKMSGPTLKDVLNDSTVPIYTSIKTSVHEATILMKENNKTAVLVKDTNEEVAGIFTSKDVVLRVIAAGLDAKTCSIVRVMTPQPDFAHHDISIQQALRQMFNGRYLNLPVVGKDNEIVGMVDVLKLTYAVLNQIKRIEEIGDGNDKCDMSYNKNMDEATTNFEGPAWHKFWSSLDEEAESSHSGTLANGIPDISKSESQAYNVDIKPSDSLSQTESPVKPPKIVGSCDTNISSYFIFKFRSPSFTGKVYRVSFKPDDGIENLRKLIDRKLSDRDYDAMGLSQSKDRVNQFAVSYADDEGDMVSMTTDNDLIDCVRINHRLNMNKINVFIHNINEEATIDVTRLGSGRDDLKFNYVSGVPNVVLVPATMALVVTSALLGFTMRRR